MKHWIANWTALTAIIVTISVWLDLGFPAQRDVSGKLYKPLFALMVQGLNGKIPLNTAGNLQAVHPDTNGTTAPLYNAGDPMYDHASHLGVSPSEIRAARLVLMSLR